MLRGRVLACVTIAAAMTAAPAGAATLTVSTTVDETIPGDHACSLREAIAAVNTPGSANGDCAPAAFGSNTIVLGPQAYILGSQFPAQRSELDVAPTVTNLTIVGAGESQTMIKGQFITDRVLEVSAGATVTLQNLTITGGHAQDGTAGVAGGGAGGDGANGGGILNSGTLTLINSAVTSSQAGNGGGGGVGGQASSGGTGGAGGAGGGIYNLGALTLQGATIAGDKSGGGGGGGAGGQGSAAGGDGGVGGMSGVGGGVDNAGGTMTVTGSTIRGNGTGDGGSGGIGGAGGTGVGGAGGAGGPVSSGGGLASSGATLAITNSTLASNFGGQGGAGGNGGSSNSAAGGKGGAAGDGGSGGAVVVNSPGGYTLQSVTVAGNRVGAGGSGGPGGTGSSAGSAGSDGASGVTGGVLDQGSTVSLQNSLLASNNGGNCAGSLADAGHNLSFAGAGCPASFAAGDPDLGPLQDNGGPSETVSLGSGSAAIDQVPATGAGCPATDQRGVSRPSGASCDIGAYEVAGPSVTSGSASPIGISSATLNATVTANAGAATVEFDYGTSTSYGKKVVVTAGGVAPVAVRATVGHLKPKATYHFRIIVSAMDGTAQTSDRTFKTSPPSSLSKLKIKPSSFRAGGRGATISYTDSLASKVTFVVTSRTGGKKLGSFTHKDRVGLNTVHFTGKLGRHRLAAGSYRLQVTARAHGKSSKAVTLRFTITP